jgi:predicted class III extradiol MEMO1 family dioxygenase
MLTGNDNKRRTKSQATIMEPPAETSYSGNYHQGKYYALNFEKTKTKQPF